MAKGVIRSTSGFEVNFLLDERIGIEVKAARNIREDDLKGLNALREEIPGIVGNIVAMVEQPQIQGICWYFRGKNS